MRKSFIPARNVVYVADDMDFFKEYPPDITTFSIQKNIIKKETQIKNEIDIITKTETVMS
jgi:hypothetical protein